VPVHQPLRFQRPSLPTAAAIERYLDLARERRWFSNFGPCWELLRDRLGKATGATAVPVASGTAGLTVAVAALRRRRPRSAGELLMPSFAFPAAAQAAVWNGLQPVFVDVDAQHWHLDPEALARALDARGRHVAVVVALSSFGTPPPPGVRDAWEAICAAANVPLLVDSAAGYGAVAADGRPIGAQGTAEVVSFHATKPMAAGEGGAVFSRDTELAETIRRLGNFGLDDDHQAPDRHGTNAKLGEPAAAIALAALDRLPAELEARRSRANALLAQLPSGLQLQAGHGLGVWQFVPLLAADAAARSDVLAAAGARVELRTYYGALHQEPAFRDYALAGPVTVTNELAARAISLPMASDLSAEEIALIAEVVADGLAARRPLLAAGGHRGP
jgi:dTDP-4-amino-4,6-dideoxygalactose transaminase